MPRITDQRQALDAAREEVEAANRELSALREELRRAGGPAGWGR
jgi:predicted  nucleic acid-binding Zn-ribbon protein